ncbi:UNVERIFIED_CONTAM: hypothetical protein GTU68_060708 [Idotea baltica]|nr:hypothetical protein [Idotea baltica]
MGFVTSATVWYNSSSNATPTPSFALPPYNPKRDNSYSKKQACLLQHSIQWSCMMTVNSIPIPMYLYRSLGIWENYGVFSIFLNTFPREYAIVSTTGLRLIGINGLANKMPV